MPCSVLDTPTYYKEDCSSVLSDNGWNATATATLCNYMGYCGFPEGADTRETPQCSLFYEWLNNNGTIVPSDEMTAVCRTYPAGVECPM